MKNTNPSNGNGVARVGVAGSATQASNPAMIAGGRGQPGAPVRSPAKAGVSGRGNGNGHGSKALKPREIKVSAHKRRTSASATTVAEPHYDTGLRFDTPGLRYAAADPVPPPPNEGAKVKLDLQSFTDAAFANFAEQHILDMTGNEYYPAPTPNAVDFRELTTAFKNALTAADSARSAAKTATNLKDMARVALSDALRQRANYVQIASNSNTAAILTSGLPVAKTRTPKGALPYPGDVRTTLGAV